MDLRQLAAAPGRPCILSKKLVASRPFRPFQQAHHSSVLLQSTQQLLTHRRAAPLDGSSASGQPAVSINSSAAAVPEPGQPDAAPAPAADAGSNHHAAAPAPAAEQAAAEAAQPLPQLSQQQQPPQQSGKKKVSNFINRVIFGIILGFGGAAVVAKGSLLYLCAAMFVVYHATQEFYGFLTSSGISQGMPPPSPFVSVATTALCLSITVFTYFRYAGRRQGHQRREEVAVAALGSSSGLCSST